MNLRDCQMILLGPGHIVQRAHKADGMLSLVVPKFGSSPTASQNLY